MCVLVGAIFVPVPPEVGPTEFQWRISACKPSCFVAGGGVIENDLLNSIDQVTFPCDMVCLLNEIIGNLIINLQKHLIIINIINLHKYPIY